MKITPGFALLFTSLCFTILFTGSLKADAVDTFDIVGAGGSQIMAQPLENFNNPWAMSFLPDGRSLVTEKTGALWMLDVDGKKIRKVGNAPSVTPRGQGGLGDVIVHPDFQSNRTVFISYVVRDLDDDALSGAVVERVTLESTSSEDALTNRKIIWRQTPMVTGNGHYSHRLILSPAGELFISSGERQKFTPAQNMSMNLGKIVRLNQDGTAPRDNPFHKEGGVAQQIWTLGHRNVLGMAFDGRGQLWAHEMGPKGGDELNRIFRSENYGYPNVSNGSHYNGKPIPSHESNPVYENPAVTWTPVISPAGFVVYSGTEFPEWQGDGFIGGLSSRALVRIVFEQGPLDNQGSAPKNQVETVAREAERFEWGQRIREVEQGPDGALYLLEDGSNGRLLRLTAPK